MIPLNSLAINHIAQNIENIKSCCQCGYTACFVAIPQIFTWYDCCYASEGCLWAAQMLAGSNKVTRMTATSDWIPACVRIQWLCVANLSVAEMELVRSGIILNNAAYIFRMVEAPLSGAVAVLTVV